MSRLIIVVGSVRRISYTDALATAVGEELEALGARPVYWRMSERGLPIADPACHDNPLRHPDPTVREFVENAADAAGFVFASPLYHNSYSGVLKNALDHLSIRQVHQKPVCLLGHGGHRSTQAVDHLRIVVRGLLGIATPSHICTSAGDYTLTDTGSPRISDPSILKRVERAAKEMLTLTECLEIVRRSPG